MDLPIFHEHQIDAEATRGRGECLRRGPAGEVRCSVLPILIGEGIACVGRLDRDVALHLLEAKAYQSGVAALRYEVKRPAPESSGTDLPIAT